MSITLRRAARPLKPLYRRLRTEWAGMRARSHPADIAFFHDFAPPPGGGGHQFLRGLWVEFERRGLRVENNTISPTTRAVLFNSFNFDPDRLRRFRRAGVRLVHRVDGPIDVYRGVDAGVDRRIHALNAEFADATIVQSRYSLEMHTARGLAFREPTVILNTPDPAIFHARGRVAWDSARRARLVASSWSDNPNKGSAVFKWLDDHLDVERFEFTFVGRSQTPLTRLRSLPPVPSQALAELLRAQDIYLMASLHESCSNGLLEALACGLPAIYVRSGSNGEIVGAGGLGFDVAAEIPALLERLTADYASYQAAIQLPSLTQVADRYLAVLGFPT